MSKKKKVNWKDVIKLCHIQCTIEEIAGFLEMDKKTLQARCQEEHNLTFADWAEEHYGKGKASLRRAQWDKAINGKDKGMMIFLGKNILGQQDKQDANFTGNFTVKIGDEDKDL